MRLLSLAVWMMTALPLSAEPAQIPTARGDQNFVTPPRRIAAFDIATIDILAALGVKVAARPQDLYVDYLGEAATDAVPVGTAAAPDKEALTSLAPDLIVVGGPSAGQFATLSKIAPVIDMSVSGDVLGQIRARLTAFGALYDKEPRARRLIAALDTRLAQLRKDTGATGKALILVVSGPKMSAYGMGSRFGWIHQATGLPEAHPGLKTDEQGTAASHEFIAETNPDWIFVIDRSAISATSAGATDPNATKADGSASGGTKADTRSAATAPAPGTPADSARLTLDNPLVATTKAAQRHHIIYLNAADIYMADGGYQSMMALLDELDTALRAGP